MTASLRLTPAHTNSSGARPTFMVILLLVGSVVLTISQGCDDQTFVQSHAPQHHIRHDTEQSKEHTGLLDQLNTVLSHKFTACSGTKLSCWSGFLLGHFDHPVMLLARVSQLQWSLLGTSEAHRSIGVFWCSTSHVIAPKSGVSMQDVWWLIRPGHQRHRNLQGTEPKLVKKVTPNSSPD